MSRRPSSSRLERRDERAARRPGNAQRPRRRREAETATGSRGGGLSTSMILAAVGVIGIAALIVYAVIQATGPAAETPGERAAAAELDDDPALPGEYFPPHPGPDGQPNTRDERLHYAPGTVVPFCTQEQVDAGTVNDPVCYTSNPPTSGPHSSTPQGFTNLENPAPKENIVHSMEHGGVYVWYNTSDQAAIDLIKSVVQDNVDRRRFVGSTAYAEMEEETIAITAWTRLDKFPVSELTRERLQEFIDAHHKRFNPEGF